MCLLYAYYRVICSKFANLHEKMQICAKKSQICAKFAVFYSKLQIKIANQQIIKKYIFAVKILITNN